ncbi:uncharacterized protein MONOS_9939 [Monocercomonoides exilis]|uniref:uncharacterized protein n=1 Tax=Monocercomonoides exilis TaxID=2049356 RepID=UPI00355AA966|nr:hypothetical protein MONOS_9939 [Monocercomonoides exilis]|eukprot:MONOS_9939.1-p1 / transcript=MONOS_9939.1 / gene=MONOS_9939 / organism=Monocercomonoides_exilis_PA203 / gene_product=unspecified product / transcript_product=unspecified product / location=Mono_scaffold00429:34822-35987(+) / protein_length=368 / sequence_SO=supercontig / SO=protein_coding / is_pseudo=false
MSMENAIFLQKNVGFCNALKRICIEGFEYSTLYKRIEKMIADEEKKEEKNEKLLVDLWECNLLLSYQLDSKMLSICVPCLLKFALKKEEDEETPKEVEMALLSLSNIKFYRAEKELYLNEIKEIIRNHQEHHNLTRLAYQSAWQFLMNRSLVYRDLKGIVMNELHFAREVGKELEEFAKCVDWKKEKEEEMGKETKEKLVLMRWFHVLFIFFGLCNLWNEEFIGLVGGIAWVLRAAKENHKKISEKYIYLLGNAAKRRDVKVEGLLKIGVVDSVLEEIQQSTLNEGVTFQSCHFFLKISERLKEKTDNDELEEGNRKATKMEIFEKLEEEGYDDTITSYHEFLHLLKVNKIDFDAISLDISEYFVNV